VVNVDVVALSVWLLVSLQTDFMDTPTALQLFSVFQFFLVFSYRYFLPF